MASELNICIVGCGGIGQRHLRAFCRIDGVACSACEPRKEIAERLGEAFPLREVFHSIDEFDFSKFDAAMISTPAHLHVPLARRCVDAGCHVIIEKPLSISLDGVYELLEASRRKNVSVGVAYTRRFLPFLVKCKELIDAGAIGSPLILDSSEGQYYPDARPDFRTNYSGRKEMGGGVILDILSHHVNFYEWLVGVPREVSCMYATLGDMGVETEDTVIFGASYDNNVLGNVVFTNIQHDQYWRSRLIGSERTLQLDVGFLNTGLERIVRPEIRLIGKHNQEEAISLGPMARDVPYQNQAKNFVNAVAGKEELRTTLEEGIHTLVTVLTAREAYDKRRVLQVKIPTTQAK